jgi:signal transduction histidine kinase
MSETLAFVCHELRNHLYGIVGFAGLLLGEKAGQINTRQRRFLTRIQESAENMLEFIEKALQEPAGRSEGSPLILTPFPLAAAIDEVLGCTGPLAEIKGLQIEAAVSSDLVLNADRTRFKQILYNLINNAVKFTPERGRVLVEASREGDSVRISVSDTGPGICMEERMVLLDRSTDVACTQGAAGDRSPLGLAIVKKLVSEHGGEISVESEPNHGSRFTFTLPTRKP